MFRCATFLFAVAKVYLFLHSANFSLFFFVEQSKILGLTGKSVSAGELDNNRTNGCPLEVSLPRIGRIMRICLWEKNRSKSLLLSLGLRPCSLMRMLSHVSELPCLTLPIRLVCPLADRKPSKQNSCRWQYKKAPLEPQRYPLTGGEFPVLWIVSLPRIRRHMHSGAWMIITSPVPICTPVPGGHYSE